MGARGSAPLTQSTEVFANKRQDWPVVGMSLINPQRVTSWDPARPRETPRALRNLRAGAFHPRPARAHRTPAATPPGPRSPPRSPETLDHPAPGPRDRSPQRDGSGCGCRRHRRQPRSQRSCWTSLYLFRSHWTGQRAAVGRNGQDSDGCLSHRLLSGHAARPHTRRRHRPPRGRPILARTATSRQSTEGHTPASGAAHILISLSTGCHTSPTLQDRQWSPRSRKTGNATGTYSDLSLSQDADHYLGCTCQDVRSRVHAAVR